MCCPSCDFLVYGISLSITICSPSLHFLPAKTRPKHLSLNFSRTLGQTPNEPMFSNTSRHPKKGLWGPENMSFQCFQNPRIRSSLASNHKLFHLDLMLNKWVFVANKSQQTTHRNVVFMTYSATSDHQIKVQTSFFLLNM